MDKKRKGSGIQPEPTQQKSCLDSKSTKNDRRAQQDAQIYAYLFTRPATMKEVDRATGIMRENVCWAIWHLRKSERVYVVGRRLCHVTKHMATVWTTNSELAPVPDASQLKIF
jgi:hypothetical protein